MTFVFHLVMLAVAGGILAIYRWKPRMGVWLAAATAGSVIAGLMMWLIMHDVFSLARHAASAIFIYAPAVLLGTAVIARRKNRRWAVLTALAALLLAGVGVDAFWIEPHWLEVTHYQIRSGKLDRPVRIVVIADPQMDSFGDYERRAFDLALAQKADLILCAGDYLQVPWEKQRQVIDAVREYLVEKDVRPPLGAFAVQGNTDPRPDWRNLFEDTPITPVSFRQTFDLDCVCLTCLSLWESNSISLEVPDPKPGTFHIVLGHIPNFARGRVQADLLIAGHTHGGQVQLPGLGPAVTNCYIPRRWASGMTALPGGGNLFVSRGIGMERSDAPRLRFLCRPEVAVIDLLPEEEKPGD
ncbi:MAG: metallophosphoesterase [Pirellulales bacterium]|nr:metallophosphoesterase [Pirellulales bacterium]